MDQSLDNKDLKTKLISIFKKNKIKILILIFLVIICFFLYLFITESAKKKNILISEKYIAAGILLSKGENEKAKKYLEEIISSGNGIYTLLALNSILEKNLILDKKKIIDIFSKLENKNLSDEQLDLVLFKKALYLSKLNDNSSKEIFSSLIKKNSKLKNLAEEIISK